MLAIIQHYASRTSTARLLQKSWKNYLQKPNGPCLETDATFSAVATSVKKTLPFMILPISNRESKQALYWQTVEPVGRRAGGKREAFKTGAGSKVSKDHNAVWAKEVPLRSDKNSDSFKPRLNK